MYEKEKRFLAQLETAKVEVSGKHLRVHMIESDEILDEYDILAFAANQEMKVFQAFVRFLDAVVPYENDTYFRLRCESYMSKVAMEIQRSNAIRECDMKTYLMTDSDTGATKIGRSKNPPKREHTLQSEKKEIKLLMVCDKNVEKLLHNKYSCKRIRGEWFNLSDQDIRDIATQYGFKPYRKGQ